MKKLDEIILIEPEIPEGERILQTLDKALEEHDSYGVLVGVDVPFDVESFAGASDLGVYHGRSNGGGGSYAFGQSGTFIFAGPSKEVIVANIPTYMIHLRDNRIFFDFEGELGGSGFANLGLKVERMDPSHPMYNCRSAVLRLAELL